MADQHSTETTIQYDLQKGIVIMTPKSNGGVAVVNPVPAVVSVQTFIEVAATLIIAHKNMREQVADHGQKNRIIGLGK